MMHITPIITLENAREILRYQFAPTESTVISFELFHNPKDKGLD